jgi:DNA-binding Lrp family transcriptional regulator
VNILVKENQQKMFKNSILPTKDNNKDNKLKESNNNVHIYSDFNIDRINLKIIKELIENPHIKSSELSEKLQIPLSTIQRRKTRIEESILKKRYYFNFSKLGYRTAEIFLNIDKGKVIETGEQILRLFEGNVIRVTSRINSASNLCIEIVFEDSQELHDILERVKSIDNTTNVYFSEVVKVIGDNTNNIIIKKLK